MNKKSKSSLRRYFMILLLGRILLQKKNKKNVGEYCPVALLTEIRHLSIELQR